MNNIHLTINPTICKPFFILRIQNEKATPPDLSKYEKSDRDAISESIFNPRSNSDHSAKLFDRGRAFIKRSLLIWCEFDLDDLLKPF